MKKISLLPPEIKHQQEIKVKTQQLIFYSILVGGAFIAIYLVLLLATLGVKIQLASLNSQGEELRTELAKHSESVQLCRQMEAIRTLESQATAGATDWVAVMAGITRCIPRNVWLTELTCQAGQVTFKGSTLTASAFAEWIKQAREMPGVKGVDSQVLKEKSGSPTEFQMNVQLAGSPAAPATAPAGGDSGGR